MTSTPNATAPSPSDVPDVVAHEIAVEQAHVDRVHRELAKATERANSVEAEGLARGRTDRTGDVRDEEMTGLFERDALVFAAARRRHDIENQFEGLVFGRLDLETPSAGGSATRPTPDSSLTRSAADDPTRPTRDGSATGSAVDGARRSSAADREIRYIGRLGVRDDDYEPLVVDWRAPAAAAFYRATPVEPMGVIRRRVLRCRSERVVGVEDDLMVPEAPDDLVIVGDGALMAALTRSRGTRMRDIVATIQRHQDEAIRAPSRGVTEITGGPGTGKTVVALHRAAYLLYSERRRFESGGILVVGPSAAYTAYIERVLPSLGEESVALRALGDLVDGMTATRVDAPEVAAVKGAPAIRRVLGRLAAATPDGAPTRFRSFVAGHAITLDEAALRRLRSVVLRGTVHNLATEAARAALREAAWATVHGGDREAFRDAWDASMDVDTFMADWWPQLDPREVLLRLADTETAYAASRGVLAHEEAAAVARSYADALESGAWTVADVALVDDLAARLGPVQEAAAEEREFWEIEELDGYAAQWESSRSPGRGGGSVPEPGAVRTPLEARERLLDGRITPPSSYAHILVDEAQDLSPMQWRMVGRRGRGASWTVVGDAAQASWPDAAQAGQARLDAYGRRGRPAAQTGPEVRRFHMDTNYRNAREIFDYARDVILPVVPDADIPLAVRETGVEPEVRELSPDVAADVDRAVKHLLPQVEGAVAVITPVRHERLVERAAAAGGWPDRVVVADPLSTKGLEYDATVVVDPDRITAESPGGARILYVVLTRAAHRMTVLREANPAR
ncbi:putative helicase protein [Nostocoides japonicum T1-X7]|uniref:Putative helicase protein n=1 Tax=Nostocoides japonicum T1-X7 TaxID=1194083 RepID=A0A077M2P4_9MICO|nr:UvrD-helicase domain-containing protein [Tetrasphaera japonica]CCH79322.1 putative helicase protein [Tetrasphaera japonica T1-X7]